jgi:hypothetical protein
MFKLTLTETADSQLWALEHDPGQNDLVKLQNVRKCLGYLQTNPKHPGLETHEFSSVRGENGEKVWEAYVENNTPSAWRVFWHYGPSQREITVVAITPHP